jgi:hypothetical protein
MSWIACLTRAGSAVAATGSEPCSCCAPRPCWPGPGPVLSASPPDSTPALRERIGLTRGIPRTCTLARLLARLDGDALDEALAAWVPGCLGAWLPGCLAAWVQLQHCDPLSASAPQDGLVKREAVAVDGKTARGSRTRDHRAVHLLAACLHGTRTVIAQRQVDSKSNEISAFRPLLEPVDLTDKVVTFDALLTQHDHARFLVEEKNAHYIALRPRQLQCRGRDACAGARATTRSRSARCR